MRWKLYCLAGGDKGEMGGRKTAIGIDVGGTKIWAAMGNEEGEIIAEYKADTLKDRNGFLDQLNYIIEDLVRRGGVSASSLCGIGIGLPGKVDTSTGTIVWVPNLPELNGLELSTALHGSWRLPTGLRNDAQLALLGEQWLGAAKGHNHVVMLTIGTGIGGAIMTDGKLWEGRTGTAGAMGWLVMDLSDPGDSERGWFERMASGSAINQRAEGLPKPFSSRLLFEAAEQGDHAAAGLVAEIGHSLGAGIANIASILDPEIIVIGGGVSRRLSQLLPSIRQAMHRYGSPSVRELPVVAASLLDRAGVIGALRLALS
jgi:glucokinase